MPNMPISRSAVEVHLQCARQTHHITANGGGEKVGGEQAGQGEGGRFAEADINPGRAEQDVPARRGGKARDGKKDSHEQ
jgi:hypothetical protein